MAKGDIDVRLRLLNAKRFERDAQGASKSVDKIGKSGQRTGRQLGKGGGLSSAMGHVGLGLAGLAAISVKTAAKYQSSMNTLQAVSGATGGQMKQLGALAIKLGADTKLPGTSAQDAAEAMTEMRKAGVSLGDTMKGVRSVLVLSAAAGIGNAQAATIASRALNTFGLKGRDVTMVTDQLANVANASSLEITDVADASKMAGSVFSSMQGPVLGAKGAMTEMHVALGILGNRAIAGSDAGTSLKQMLLAVAGASGPAQDAMRGIYLAAQNSSAAQGHLTDVMSKHGKVRTKALDAIVGHNAALKKGGNIAYTAAGKMRSLKDMIALTTAGTKNMTQEQRNAAIATIFGSDASRSVLALMKAGPGAYGKMEKSVRKQGSAQALASAKMKGFNGSMDAMKSTVQTLAITFGTVLLPPLTKVLQKVTALAGKLGQHKTAVIATIGVLGTFAATVYTVNKAMKAARATQEAYFAAKKGFKGLVAAGRLAARGLNAVFARGGTAAGEAVAANTAESMAGQMPKSISARQGRINRSFTSMGKLAGRTFGIAAGLFAVAEFSNAVAKGGLNEAKPKDYGGGFFGGALSTLSNIGNAPINLGAKVLGIKAKHKSLPAPLPGGPTRLPGKRIAKAAGGLIGGFGSGDTVPAMLTPGEFVMRRQAVQKLGPTFFTGLNQGVHAPAITARHSIRVQPLAATPLTRANPRAPAAAVAQAPVHVTITPAPVEVIMDRKVLGRGVVRFVDDSLARK